MKKLFLLLVASGMIVASAGAQTQRVNRTNTRNKMNADKEKVEKLPDIPARNTDAATENSSGVTGTDGSINNAANSGVNRSSSLNYDYKTNDVPPTTVPAVNTTTAPAPPPTPVTPQPDRTNNKTR